MAARHPSLESYLEREKRGNYEDEDEDLLKFWLILKDVEKLFTESFCNIVNIQELHIQLSIRGRNVSLVSDTSDYRRGIIKMVYEGGEYLLPEAKYKLISDLKKIPGGTLPVPIPKRSSPERQEMKKVLPVPTLRKKGEMIFGELVNI